MYGTQGEAGEIIPIYIYMEIEKRLRHGSLFSGIGGFDLAAEWMGWENMFQCEIDKYCRKVLDKNFKNVIIYDDITKTDFQEWRGRIDIISGGVPCQPFSRAGLQRGKNDERYLWGEYLRAIRECQPQWLVAENVSGLLSTNNGVEYENIISQMEDEGYQTLSLLLPSTIIGAQHIRERIWIIGRYFMEANTDTKVQGLGKVSDKGEEKGSQDSLELSRDINRLSWYETISRVHGELNGLSRRMDGHRNRALGNAIVPQVAYEIFKAIGRCEEVVE